MLYIVTAVFNRYAITERFVDNLKKQTYQDFTLVLVDDGSTDGTDAMVKRKLPDAHIIYGDGNLWWGGALHEAYKHIISLPEVKDDDMVLFTNDDTRTDDDFIEIGVNLLKKNPDAQITACGYSVNSGKQIDGAVSYDFRKGISMLLAGSARGNCASTRKLMMTVKTMRQIGGFHPVLLPHYASDYEYTIRGARKGFPVLSFEEFRYEFDEGTTGDNSYDKLTLKKLFGKRSAINPIYRMSFIMMATPPRYLPSHLASQIGRYAGKMDVLEKIIKR